MAIAHLPQHSGCVLEALNNQRQVGQHCDVTILAANNIKLNAHSCLLAAISPYLQRTMLAKTRMNQKIELCLADYSPEVLQICLNMVYTGKLQFPHEDSLDYLLEQVRYVANSIKLEPVIAACEQVSFDKSKTNSSDMCPDEGLTVTENLSAFSGDSRPSCHSLGLHQMKKEDLDQDVNKLCSPDTPPFHHGAVGNNGSTNLNDNLAHTETNLVNHPSSLKNISLTKNRNTSEETEDFLDKNLKLKKYRVCKSKGPGAGDIECNSTGFSNIDHFTSTLHSDVSSYTCEDILELSSAAGLEGYGNSKDSPAQEVVLEKHFEVGHVGSEHIGAAATYHTFPASKQDLTFDHLYSGQKNVHVGKETSEQTTGQLLPLWKERTIVSVTSQHNINITEDADTIKITPKSEPLNQEGLSSNIGMTKRLDSVHFVKPGLKFKPTQSVDNSQQTRRSRRLAKKESQSSKHILKGQALKRGLETQKQGEQTGNCRKQAKIRKILKDVERKKQLQQTGDIHDRDEVYELSKDDSDQAEILKSFSSITSELLRLQRDGLYDPHVPTERELEGENQEELRQDTGIIVEEGDADPGLVQATFMEVVKAIARIKEGQPIHKTKTGAISNLNVSANKVGNEDLGELGIAKTGAKLEDWKKCKYCSKYKGKKKGRYAFHVQYCHSQYKCTFCFKPFLNEHDLSQHKCDRMNVFICHLCGKVLRNKAALHLHMKHHKGEKNKICQHCGKAFTRSCYLQAHIARAHSKDRPYQCEHCDAAYALKFELNRHMYKHSTEPNFICETCGDKFFERSKWVFHKKAKHSSSVDSTKGTISLEPPVGMAVFNETWQPELPCIAPGGSTVLESGVHGLELVSSLQTTKADTRMSEVQVNTISGVNNILEQVCDVVNDIPHKGLPDNIHNQWIIYQIDAQGHLSYQGNIQ